VKAQPGELTVSTVQFSIHSLYLSKNQKNPLKTERKGTGFFDINKRQGNIFEEIKEEV
jgi:hypothetical protein